VNLAAEDFSEVYRLDVVPWAARLIFSAFEPELRVSPLRLLANLAVHSRVPECPLVRRSIVEAVAHSVESVGRLSSQCAWNIRELASTTLCHLAKCGGLDLEAFRRTRLGGFVGQNFLKIPALLYLVGQLVKKCEDLAVVPIGPDTVRTGLDHPEVVPQACWALTQFYGRQEMIEDQAPTLLEWAIEKAPEADFKAKEHIIAMACSIFRRMPADRPEAERIEQMIGMLEDAAAIGYVPEIVCEAQSAVVAIRNALEETMDQGDALARINALADTFRATAAEQGESLQLLP
jgi:hypothetical protein